MAVDMFIQIGDLKGESKDDKHKGKFDVLAWSWGAAQQGTMHSGGGGGTGKVTVQDLSFTKHVDVGSHSLLQSLCKASTTTEATLIVRKAGNGKPVEYITIKLEDVLVTSVSTGGSGGEERLTENVTLNFAKFKFIYKEQDKAGAQAGGDKEYGYDVEANKPL
jgi:type VI secretion system secreted protein Hcp